MSGMELRQMEPYGCGVVEKENWEWWWSCILMNQKLHQECQPIQVGTDTNGEKVNIILVRVMGFQQQLKLMEHYGHGEW